MGGKSYPEEELMNIDLPKREAVLEWRRDEGQWETSIDVDPILIPTENGNQADVFDPSLLGLMDAILTWEELDRHVTYRLVWSDTGELVQGTCPKCDRDFVVSEGHLIELNIAIPTAVTTMVCCQREAV